MQLETVSFRTVGCRLNQAESGVMAAQFSAAGYRIVEAPAIGEVAIVHSCTITRQAERTCLQLARRMRRAGARVVVVAGCAVEHNALRMSAGTGADILVGQRDKFRLPELLAARGISPPTASARCESPSCCSAIGEQPLPLPHPADAALTPTFTQTRALIKLQDGCDFGCAYCIVPSTRGAPVSRPLADVRAEARRFADRGYREVVLAGANLGCYANGPHRLADVLMALESIAGIDRIRLSSIEVSTSERDVIDVMATSPKMCRFLHVPLQSGDNGVLARMGRRYTREGYADFVAEAVRHVPGLGLGTDVIVGLPGEDDDAFRHTVELVDRLPFSNLHVFAYSRREGTRAAAMPDQVPAADKKTRSSTLIALGAAKRRTFASAWLRRPVQVLVEGHDGAGNACGWSGEYLPVKIGSGDWQVNDLVTVTPHALDDATLLAGT